MASSGDLSLDDSIGSGSVRGEFDDSFHAPRRCGWPMGHLERRVHPATTQGPARGRGIVTTTILVIVEQFPFACGLSIPAATLRKLTTQTVRVVCMFV